MTQDDPEILSAINDNLIRELTVAIREAEKLLLRTEQRDDGFYKTERSNLELALETARQELIQLQTLRHMSAMRQRESNGESAVMAAFHK
jgi:hypothetical protein